MSAHRTPATVQEYASTARDRGLKVIIAAAGGAAHLAGVVAAHTTLPVIGLPVPTPELGGLDSLLSTVQMPGDVPVATVAVGMGGARNAGLLAVQILAVSDDALAAKFAEFKQGLEQKIAAKDAQTAGDHSRRCRLSGKRSVGWAAPMVSSCCWIRPACPPSSAKSRAGTCATCGKRSRCSACAGRRPSASPRPMASCWGCSRSRLRTPTRSSRRSSR